ncbi:FGFR1 oncoprotein partner [Chytriomyces hyalinus]|nr:FGFR1 oncoprotein partner [Chytriomyces hyalinus]
MSSEELKGLVGEALGKNGTLGRIKAELRASVYAVLKEMEGTAERTPAKKRLDSSEETAALAIITDFLTYYKLDYTLSVLGPEAATSASKADIEDVAQDLHLSKPSKKPLLLQMIEDRMAMEGARKSLNCLENVILKVYKSRVKRLSSDAFCKDVPSVSNSSRLPTMQQSLKSLSLKGLDEKEDDEEEISEYLTSERTISRSTSVGNLDVLETI